MLMSQISSYSSPFSNPLLPFLPFDSSRQSSILVHQNHHYAHLLVLICPMKAISKLSRCIKFPMRVLCRARDLYVKSMNAYAVRVPSSLPKSFSVSSAIRPIDESGDLRTLTRMVSQQRQQQTKDQEDENMAHQQQQVIMSVPSRRSNSRLPKSLSVGMGRIDENKPCDFAEDDFAHFNPGVIGSYALTANRKARLQY